MRRVRAALAVLALATATPAAGQVRVFVEKGPAEGEQPADFSLTAVTADTLAEPGSFSLWRSRGEVVVLAFFPKAFMSGTDAQFVRFRDDFAGLFGDGVAVVGISQDPAADLARYAAFHALPFRLASDPGAKIGQAFGLLVKGETTARRAVYVIGRDGRVTYRDLRFDWSRPAAYDRLRTAVQAARR